MDINSLAVMYELGNKKSPEHGSGLYTHGVLKLCRWCGIGHDNHRCRALGGGVFGFGNQRGIGDPSLVGCFDVSDVGDFKNFFRLKNRYNRVKLCQVNLLHRLPKN